MGNFIYDIELADNRISYPIKLQGALNHPIQLTDNRLTLPIKLGFPEAPTLSEFDYDLDSPMA